ncbi:hypothetical protein G7Y89_g3912 [Cudoniella acicularis]|uniref:Heterokaryon incompatibility domain-containing protein n=1 Tax=Cudoniella acicularis TaxID=354080 RepID=A0A8H4RSJ9_9HELO|nr:hypothetical protein G7Y89_g3912 [Cudoniella acicularis]
MERLSSSAKDSIYERGDAKANRPSHTIMGLALLVLVSTNSDMQISSTNENYLFVSGLPTAALVRSTKGLLMATKSSYTSDSGEDHDSSELCNLCRNIDLEKPLSLHDLKDDCVLCQILSKRLEEARNKEPEIRLLKARQYVRICAVLEPQDDSRRSKSIPPGLPGFLQSGSPLHFELIKEWVRLCNEGKCSQRGACCPEPDRDLMPTRVIDVGNGPTAPLILTNKDKIGRGERYVALSHCWGKPTEEEKGWSTTCENKERRAQGFPDTELPQTFQDAIRVTRELSQRYLWIDSLCIIQDDPGDWDTESKKMKAVFKNAYCTIAATSAEDSTKGFLNRPLKEEDSQYVTVPKSSHGKVYVCTSIDDFPGDVEEGLLNKRAWVLQERALSRRTIHFTKRQTYWECGGGVRCETLTYMRNAKLSFLSDPEFPRSIIRRSLPARIKLFQSLFTDYSNLDITYPTDRPVAIDSLATVLAEALHTNVRYGIFECFLHQSLLWQRAQNISLRQISYPAGKAPPSWSWMAYCNANSENNETDDGQIQYLQDRHVEWDSSVQFVKAEANNYVLEARVRWLQDFKIKPEGVIHDQKDNEVGHLWFDSQPGKALSEVRCAIMGREKTRTKDGKRKYYVLFVTESATHPGRGKFGRVGMGWIQQRFILFDDQDDTAQIL